MIGFLFKKIFGSKNDREIRRLRPTVAKINELEEGLKTLTDDDLRSKTLEWKTRLSEIKEVGS